MEIFRARSARIESRGDPGHERRVPLRHAIQRVADAAVHCVVGRRCGVCMCVRCVVDGQRANTDAMLRCCTSRLLGASLTRRVAAAPSLGGALGRVASTPRTAVLARASHSSQLEAPVVKKETPLDALIRTKRDESLLGGGTQPRPRGAALLGATSALSCARARPRPRPRVVCGARALLRSSRQRGACCRVDNARSRRARRAQACVPSHLADGGGATRRCALGCVAARRQARHASRRSTRRAS